MRTRQPIEARRAYQRAWRMAHPGVATEYSRAHRQRHGRAADIATQYRISLAEAKRLLAEMPDVCDLCGEASEEKLHYHHDHATGKFQGWLCRRCNVGLGMFRDDPEQLDRAARFLRERA